MKLKKSLVATLALLAVFSYPLLAQTVGPAGEAATPSSSVVVPNSKVKQVQAGKYKAALVWHEQSEFVTAVTAGITSEFTRLGIELVAVTSASWDAAKQRSDIETTLLKKPDIIISLPVDGVTAAPAFKDALNQGVKLVFLSVAPVDYKHPTDYAAIVTDDLFQMGKQAADALAKAMGKKGTVGWIYHDAAFYVTNQRDNAFKATIEKDYPNIRIVSEQGISDPARAEEIANAMLLKNPDLGGIYTPWAGPAEGVLAALRANGNKTTKVVTLDLSEPIALDMVKDGNIVAIVADEAFELGRAMAAAGVRALLGESTPPFIVAPALTVTKSNIREGWMQSQKVNPPASVLNAR